MDITDKDIIETARLAHLALTEEEVALYRRNVGDVLTYFEKLDAVDVEGVPEIGHITGRSDVLRSDEERVTSAQEREQILDEVPNEESGYIKVKNVL